MLFKVKNVNEYGSEYIISRNTWSFGKNRMPKVSLFFYKQVCNGFEIQHKRKPKVSSFYYPGTKLFCSLLRKCGFLES